MFKTKRYFVLLFALMFFACSISYADNYITPDKLPSYVKNFVKENFPNTKIISAEIDEYEDKIDIVIDNGISIEFKHGEWYTVEGKHNNIEGSYIPKQVMNYVRTNYPGKFIREIEKNKYTCDVELNDKTELVFSKNWEFVRRK